jgi:hypothetical protein
MNTTFSRSCLILALLSLVLVAAVSVGLNPRHGGVTVQAHTAGMQLQAGPEADEGSVESDVEESQADKATACAQRASHDLPPKQDLAFALSEDRRPRASKAVALRGEEMPPKSKD